MTHDRANLFLPYSVFLTAQYSASNLNYIFSLIKEHVFQTVDISYDKCHSGMLHVAEGTLYLPFQAKGKVFVRKMK